MARLVILLLCLLALPFPVRAQALTDAPSVSDHDYPGAISLAVDATDVSRRIYRVRERIPVQPGPLKLWYPQWIPGNHAATGPINQFAGLVIAGNGQRIEWRRDPLDVYAFHLEVPAGVSALDIEFQSLSPTADDQGRVAMTTELMSVQWSPIVAVSGRLRRASCPL